MEFPFFIYADRLSFVLSGGLFERAQPIWRVFHIQRCRMLRRAHDVGLCGVERIHATCLQSETRTAVVIVLDSRLNQSLERARYEC